MKIKFSIPKFFFFILVLLMVYILVISSFLNTLNDDNLYRNHIINSNLENKLSSPDLKINSIRGYLINDDDTIVLPDIIFADKTMTAEEISHMKDVKKVISNLSTSYYFALILVVLLLIGFISGLLTKYKNEKEIRNKKVKIFFYKLALRTMVFSSIILITGFISSQFAFEYTFLKMHELFFPQGNWEFHVSTLLITLFPESFFNNFLTNVVTRFLQGFVGVSFMTLLLFLATKNTKETKLSDISAFVTNNKHENISDKMSRISKIVNVEDEELENTMGHNSIVHTAQDADEGADMIDMFEKLK